MSAKRARAAKAPEKLVTLEEREKERRKVTKKFRFEIFKRDSFTCQYCGEAAPNVVLHADHIKPVSKGGKTTIINMVTSCAGCNGGKGARELSDDSAVSMQQSQLAELQEKRVQLDMMLEWRGAMQGIEADSLNAIVSAMNERIEPRSLTENGKAKVKKWIRKYSMPDLFKAIDISAESYLEFDSEGDVELSSIDSFFNKITGICKNLNADEFDSRKHYVKGICRNRFSYFNEGLLWTYLSECKGAGVFIADIESAAKESKNWTQFTEALEDLING